MIDTQQLLREGIAAAKAGNRDAARQALMQVIAIDERNEQAWIWLAGVVDDPADQRVCLENVLDLNPANPHARRGLAWLEQRYPSQATPLDKAAHAPPPVPPPIPAPFSAPVQSPATNPTIRLPTDDNTTQTTRSPEPPPPPPAAEPEPDQYPCPYCGAPTMAWHHTCPECHKSLMVRGAPREKRSLATTIVGILWIISGIPTVLGGLFWIGFMLYASSQVQSGPDMPEFIESFNQSITLIIVLGILILVWGGFMILLGRAYLQRKPWAYILNAILLGLSLIVGVFQIGTMLFTGIATSAMAGSMHASGDLTDFYGSLVLAIICAIVLLGGHLALTILGYRDFYGPRMRMLPEVEAQDDVGLYNIGVAFKNRGMWYMAMKTWETAARLSPRQANYHHALGLAYAQLNQFERAIPTLQEAIKLDPNNRRIQESLKLVEEQAAKAQKRKRSG